MSLHAIIRSAMADPAASSQRPHQTSLSVDKKLRMVKYLVFFTCLIQVLRETDAWAATKSPFSLKKSTLFAGAAATMSTYLDPTRPLPKLPLPEPICSTTPNTWAYDTMSRRVNEEILQRTFEENQNEFESAKFQEVLKRFQALRQKLKSAGDTKLTYLDDLPEDSSQERVREYNEWKELLKPFVEAGDTWLSAPWLITEFYVYRLLMQALGYWDKDSAGYQYDPFAKQKRAGLTSSAASAEPMLTRIPSLPPTKEGIELAAAFALWGNKMDLSLWPADAANQNIDVFTEILEKAAENLLHDDSDALGDYCDKLRSKGGGNVDIVVDNAGFELVTDLALGQHLVESGIAKCVTFQLKSHPTFVSDALEKDLVETVDYYASLDVDAYPNAKKAGQVWKEFLADGRWKCNEDNFWVQPFAMWDMTEPLRTDMKERCDLAFIKGDANYRRLLGDRMWEFTAPFSDVVGAYFPCPVCALRTLKAELGCGMDAEQVERAKSLDDQWLVNGRFGVVQFDKGADK